MGYLVEGGRYIILSEVGHDRVSPYICCISSHITSHMRAFSVFGGSQMDVQKRLAQKAADCLRWRCFENDGPNRGKMRQVARRYARRVLRQVDAREVRDPE